ncbi:MAG: 2-succinyl-5-enolpyruvyl-6-hydroxy-3-cyclohexene-1-carboxylic-acid synthase [Bacteroidota bacterium]
MTSDKKNISLLADLFVKSGLTDIVISPGSRNAPIILSFVNRAGINAFSIVDERSAAFFALGLALNSKKTVAIACTSGSAVLNYASAISEAYYQKIPLLVITADRPINLIDIGDGQTIRQRNIYENYIKKSYQLPATLDTDAEFEAAEKIINEAINGCVFPQAGPIHINIPFDEPIYGTTKKHVVGKLAFRDNSTSIISKSLLKEVVTKWNNSNKVLIIVGQWGVSQKLVEILEKICQNSNTVVLTETTSNLFSLDFIDTIDNIVSSINDNEIELFKPDIIISFGGQIVSKMIKKFLRDNKPQAHWHISPSGEELDTYFSLTIVIKYDEFAFFESVIPNLLPVKSSYFAQWTNRKNKVSMRKDEYISKIEYSDFKVFDSIFKQLPENSVLHLGNSTPVRYSQLFGSEKNINYNSNRGVSGIDGQVSTAAGFAYASDKLNVLITGDLGFFYDSNGLMNKYLKPNLKIIVINNSGGGIFRFISGPDTSENLDEFFVAKHNWSAEYICKAFNVNYTKADNTKDLENILPYFLKNESVNTELLEIFTPSEINAKVLREYFKFIKKAE